MKSLLNADDDWIETVRRWLYPRIHGTLQKFGGYALGGVYKNQYVGTYDIDEEPFEEILADLGFERNPIACLKRDPHKHVSEGSWALRSHDDRFGYLERDRQLHVTLFAHDDGGLEVYAHNEYDWQDAPLKHLNEVDFQPVYGRDQMRKILNEQTDLSQLPDAQFPH